MLIRSSNGRLFSALTQTRYAVTFDETFDRDVLDERRWVPYYLPHWSSRERSAARYRLTDGALHLRIEADQPPWCPDVDGEVRVSGLQTGLSAGPVGGRAGQVRFHPDLTVRESQPELRLYTPRYGVVEVRARATADPRSMVALWMVRPEYTADSHGELCVCEIYGHDVGPRRARVGVGVKRWSADGPVASPDFARVDVGMDAREPHTYAVEWNPHGAVFYIDGRPVHGSLSVPEHPLQLMLTIYRFPAGHPETPSVPAVVDVRRDPPEFVVDHVRGYRAVD